MDMGKILAVFNNLQNNNMSATPNDNFKGDQSMKKLKEGHAGHRDAYEAGDADAYYGRPSRPNKAVNGKTLWDDELTPEEQADYRRGYKENPCGRKDWGHSGYIREGFISNTLNKMAISKQAKAAGYKGYKKSIGEFLSQIMMDSTGEHIIVRITKDGAPYKKFHVENMEELASILAQADKCMAGISESLETNPNVIQLAKRIKALVRSLKADGTGGMSAANMKQIIDTRGLTFANPYHFEQSFKEALKLAGVGNFVARPKNDMSESAAPGQEAWIKTNKAKFKKEYGDKKGEEVLYATAWKRSKARKKVNEDYPCPNCWTSGKEGYSRKLKLNDKGENDPCPNCGFHPKSKDQKEEYNELEGQMIDNYIDNNTVKESWKDGYWTGDMKDGYPSDYYDENDKLTFPWEKNLSSSSSIEDGDTSKEVEITKFLLQHGFNFETKEPLGDGEYSVYSKDKAIIEVHPSGEWSIYTGGRSSGDFLKDGQGLPELVASLRSHSLLHESNDAYNDPDINTPYYLSFDNGTVVRFKNTKAWPLKKQIENRCRQVGRGAKAVNGYGEILGICKFDGNGFVYKPVEISESTGNPFVEKSRRDDVNSIRKAIHHDSEYYRETSDHPCEECGKYNGKSAQYKIGGRRLCRKHTQAEIDRRADGKDTVKEGWRQRAFGNSSPEETNQRISTAKNPNITDDTMGILAKNRDIDINNNHDTPNDVLSRLTDNDTLYVGINGPEESCPACGNNGEYLGMRGGKYIYSCDSCDNNFETPATPSTNESIDNLNDILKLSGLNVNESSTKPFPEDVTDWRETFPESALDYEQEDATCSECGKPLDYSVVNGHAVCDECGFIEDDSDKCLRCDGTDGVDDSGLCYDCRNQTSMNYDGSNEFEEPMTESLSPKRENTGLNGSSRGWANSPNEQMASWKALIQDADGPNNPKDMFNPVKGSDNIMTVAANKKDEKLHEDAGINALAEKLQEKFHAEVSEATTKFANQINAKDCLKFAATEKKGKKKTVKESYGELNPAGEAVMRRIISQYPKSISHYGPEEVTDAVCAFTSNLTDLDEIGSSDVSIWTDEVLDWLFHNDTHKDTTIEGGDYPYSDSDNTAHLGI